MMYQKALCFHDNDVVSQILSTTNATEIKVLGRIVSNYDESLWNGARQIVVFEGLLTKFSQNETLKSNSRSLETQF